MPKAKLVSKTRRLALASAAENPNASLHDVSEQYIAMRGYGCFFDHVVEALETVRLEQCGEVKIAIYDRYERVVEMVGGKRSYKQVMKRMGTYVRNKLVLEDVGSFSFTVSDGEEIEVLETSADDQDSLESAVANGEYKTLIEAFLRQGRLSAAEREIFMSRLQDFEGVTQLEFAETIEVSRGKIQSLEQGVMQKCRKFLIRKGFKAQDLRV